MNKTLLATGLLFTSTLLSTALLASAANQNKTFPQVESLLDQGDYRQALTVLQSKPEDSIEWHLTNTKLQLQNGNLDQAEAYIEKLQTKYPTSAKARLVIGQVQCALINEVSFFSKKSQAETCLSSFKQSVELDSSYWQGHSALASFYGQAPSIVGGDEELAIKHAKHVLAANELAGMTLLMRIYAKQEDQQALDTLVEEAKQKHTNSPQIWYQLGSMAQRQEKPEAAIQHFTKASQMAAVEKEDKFAKYSSLYQLAKTAVESEQSTALGITSLQQYLAANYYRNLPPKAWAEFRLAQLYVMNKQQADAKRLLLRIDSSDDKELKKKIKKQLKKLKKVKV